MGGGRRPGRTHTKIAAPFPRPAMGPRDLAIACCFFLSGAAALAFEIAWVRKASLVFGGTMPALSTVLATFFAGLALGSFLMGRASQRLVRPLRAYGLVEMGVGILGMATPTAFRWADGAYGWVYAGVVDSPAVLAVARAALTSLIILPPTVLMGASLPLLCRHYVRDPQRISLAVGTLYGINTIGAAFGAAACGFWMIPALGVNLTVYTAGALCLVIGATARRMGKTAPLPEPENREPKAESRKPKVESRKSKANNDEPPESAGPGIVHVLFLLTGFVALANEVLWTRFLSLMIYNTVHTYTLTLTLALVGIALGSFATSRLFDGTPRRSFLFGLIQVVSGLSVLLVVMLPARLWNAAFDPSDAVSRLYILAAVMFLPAVLSGMSFPLAIRMVLSDPRRAGTTVGGMTAVNTVGGILGSLAAGFVLVPRIGLQNALLATTALNLLVAFAAWWALDRSSLARVKIVLAPLCVAAWIAIPLVTGTRLPDDHLKHGGTLLAVREGLTSHLAVIDRNGRRRLEMDKLWQGEDRKTHQIMAAHLPMLLHPDPRDVLAIGMGTGQTFSRFLMYDIDRLDCVEIEPRLVELLREYYDTSWMDDPRCRIIVADGRNYVLHSRKTYDVISVAVGQAFRPGVAVFYTSEFYRDALRRLKPGGVICQFLPLAFFTREEFRSIVRTFVDAVSDAALWYNNSELLLVGSRDSPLGLRSDRLALLQTNQRVRDDLRFAYWGGRAHWLNRPEMFLSGFLMNAEALDAAAGDAPIYTDDVPALEYSASGLTGRHKWNPAGLRLIGDHLSPISSACAFAVDASTLRAAEQWRPRNLDDILATRRLAAATSASLVNDRPRQIALLERALEHNPDNVRVLGKLGEALLQSGRLDEAVTYYEDALRLAPESAVVHSNLAVALAGGGEIDKACDHLREALRIDPGYRDARDNLNHLLERLNGAE